MKKIALVSLVEGEECQEIFALTGPLMQRYAFRHGFDFIVLTGQRDHRHIFYRKLDIASLLTSYQTIVYIDADVVISPSAPAVTLASCSAFDEHIRHPAGNATQVKFERFLVERGYPAPPRRRIESPYYNTGVMVLDESVAHLLPFADEYLDNNPFVDQGWFNYILSLHRTPVQPLPEAFNWMRAYHQSDNYFTHFAGYRGARRLDLICRCIEGVVI